MIFEIDSLKVFHSLFLRFVFVKFFFHLYLDIVQDRKPLFENL